MEYIEVMSVMCDARVIIWCAAGRTCWPSPPPSRTHWLLIVVCTVFISAHTAVYLVLLDDELLSFQR